jgi:alpha-tubulin suppressor-like RCC1 family protein
VQVQNLSGVKSIAGGNFHSLALKDDGTLWAWGWNLWGQLSDATTQDRSTPVRVQNLSGVFAIAAGGDHSLALKGNGLVSCFTLPSCTVWGGGENSSGQLGDGTTNDRSTPAQVVSGEPPGNYLSGVTAIAAGLGYSLAVKTDGTVRAWVTTSVASWATGRPSPSATRRCRYRT